MKRLAAAFAIVALMAAAPLASIAQPHQYLLTISNDTAKWAYFMVYEKAETSPSWKVCIRAGDGSQRMFRSRILIVSAQAFTERCSGPGSRLESVTRKDDAKSVHARFSGTPSNYRLRWD